MNIEYLIIGITKDSKEDFKELYRVMHAPVYALALATVKDKSLAREIATETFRRIKTYAYTFDTELNGEYWILDIVRQLSLNALQEQPPKDSHTEAGIADNASALILRTLSQLKNERGVILTLQSVSKLSGKDIASLSGFYRSSASSEARRGLVELRAFYPKLSMKDLRRMLKDDFAQSCPDYLEYIEMERPTKVAHISHEAMFLAEDEARFHGESESENIQVRTLQRKNRTVKRIKIAIIATISCLVLISGICIIYQLVKDARFPETPEYVQTDASMDMVEVEGILYYRDGKGIYAYNALATDEKITRLYEGAVRDMISVETGLCFRNNKDGKIYYMDYQGNGLKQMTDYSGTSLAYGKDGCVYFNAHDGIYKFALNQENPEVLPVYTEEVENAPTRYHMGFSENGKLFFSAGADGGIYGLEENSLYGFYLDEAYYFQIQGQYLFFDAIGLRDVRYLYGINLEKDGQDESAQLPEIRLYSAAYFVTDGYIYYEGYGEESDSSLGLYCLNLSDGTRTRIEDTKDAKLHVTDIYVSDGKMYCYYSDGQPEGTRTLTVRSLSSLDKTETIF